VFTFDDWDKLINVLQGLGFLRWEGMCHYFCGQPSLGLHTILLAAHRSIDQHLFSLPSASNPSAKSRKRKTRVSSSQFYIIAL
jgi:hypothetical protein